MAGEDVDLDRFCRDARLAVWIREFGRDVGRESGKGWKQQREYD